MKKPSGSAAAKQASSAKPGFQPSAVAQFTAIEISSGRIGRMRKLFMAGDRTDGFMNYITGGDAMAVPPRQAGPNSEPGSSFRDWAGNFPREITETALAHIIGDKAKQAYRRSDALEKRRRLMEAWAAYCERTTGNVVQIGERKTP